MYPHVMQRLREEAYPLSEATGTRPMTTWNKWSISEQLSMVNKISNFCNRVTNPCFPLQRRWGYAHLCKSGRKISTIVRTVKLTVHLRPFGQRSSINAMMFVNKTPEGKPIYVPQRTRIIYSVFLTHWRKDLWGPDGKFSHSSLLNVTKLSSSSPSQGIRPRPLPRRPSTQYIKFIPSRLNHFLWDLWTISTYDYKLFDTPCTLNHPPDDMNTIKCKLSSLLFISRYACSTWYKNGNSVHQALHHGLSQPAPAASEVQRPSLPLTTTLTQTIIIVSNQFIF